MPGSGSGEFYLPDRLWSIRQISNAVGHITKTNFFVVFGELKIADKEIAIRKQNLTGINMNILKEIIIKISVIMLKAIISLSVSYVYYYMIKCLELNSDLTMVVILLFFTSILLSLLDWRAAFNFTLPQCKAFLIFSLAGSIVGSIQFHLNVGPAWPVIFPILLFCYVGLMINFVIHQKLKSLVKSKVLIAILLLCGAFANSRAESFAGHEGNDGVYYARYRNYDSEIGGFISRDPLGYPDGPSAYTYVIGNPINLVDPLGLDSDIAGTWGGSTAFVVGGSFEVKAGFLTPDGFLNDIVKGVLGTRPYVQGSIGGLLGAGAVAGSFEGGVTVGGMNGFVEPGTYWTREHSGLAVGGLYGIGGSIEVTGSEVWNPMDHNAAISRNRGSFSYGGWETSFEYRATPASAFVGYAPKWGAAHVFPSIGDLFGVPWYTSTFNSIGNFYSNLFGIGGVLIDKAAELIGSNLSDIKGATYDPVSKQIVLLGSNNASAVKDLNLDYFYTALQAIYGSPEPPFISLDTPAREKTAWTDYGNGNGTFENGEQAGFTLSYDPNYANQPDRVRIQINLNGYKGEIWLDSYASNSKVVDGRPLMLLRVSSISGLPPGVSLDQAPFFNSSPANAYLTVSKQYLGYPVIKNLGLILGSS
jgi:RHS repeat-associated protein